MAEPDLRAPEGGPGSPGPRRPGRRPPRHRPPWWPADEPWPPTGPGDPELWAGWRHGPFASRSSWGGRRGGPWRGFGCLFGAILLLVAWILIAVAVSVLAAVGLVGSSGGGALQIAALTVLALGIAAIVAVGRVFRASTGALDDLVDAARRVEAGEYATRVAPRAGRAPRPIRELLRAFDTMAGRLEADESSRQALLADVSHELRTPLAVIRGSLEAIADGVHPADAAHIGAILDETEVMERLVEDLRTVALAEAGRLPLHREPTDVDVLLGETAAAFAAAAERAGIRIVVEAPADLPLADVDPVRIREVISNLVANALRHTPAGGTIRLEGVAEAAAGIGRGPASAPTEPPALLLAVSDTGPGIDPALRPHVFDRFAKDRASTGSGLGLAIARDLVEAHGGTIVVECPPAGGTVFRIRLPLEPA